MNDPVIIVDYDRIWPQLFEEEKGRIFQSLGHRSLTVEHIGSTAVPGLAAKPIIDILIGVKQLSEAREYISFLQKIGYEYVPEFEKVIPERLFFRKGMPPHRTHHIHLVEKGSDFWERHLRFRDILRANPDIAREYELLKKDLALKFSFDRDAYSNSKTEFIERVLSGIF